MQEKNNFVDLLKKILIFSRDVKNIFIQEPQKHVVCHEAGEN
jgi:hypothetical protein